MTSANRQQLKELKRPDAIQLKLTQVLNWLLENARYLAFAAVPVALGVGGYYGFRYFQDSKKKARLEELGKVQVVYEDEQRKAAEARQAVNTKIEALEKKAPAAGEGAAKDKPKDPKVSGEVEKLRNELSAIRADHNGSMAKFLEFNKKYPDEAEGWLAGMMVAQIFAEEGKVAEALQVVQDVLSKSQNQPFYEVQGRFFLAGLMEEAGQWDQALGELDTLEKSLDKLGVADFKPKVILARGRVLLLKNDKEAAKKAFVSLTELHAGSPEAQKARAYQTILN